MGRRGGIDRTHEFLLLSEKLTGFSTTELQALELGGAYLQTVLEQAGSAQYERISAALLGNDHDVSTLVGAERELAAAIAYLWYAGAWPGAERTAAPEAYAGSLVWRTFGGRPPGSLAAGFGSWSAPPTAAPARAGGAR